jgi:hypothetical protein
MLLCEVALGDMLELSTGKLIEKSYLDSIGKNSTKGYACVRATTRWVGRIDAIISADVHVGVGLRLGSLAPSPKGAAYLYGQPHCIHYMIIMPMLMLMIAQLLGVLLIVLRWPWVWRSHRMRQIVSCCTMSMF